MARSTLFPARLYGLVDLSYVDEGEAVPAATAMVAGGIDAVQLRAKDHTEAGLDRLARRLLPICRDGGVPFIVNDSPRVAAETGADGVHVGQDDASMNEVRAITGDDMLVGRSTHSLAQATEAAADPRTDYIGFGPVFATPTKPDYAAIGTDDIRQVHDEHPDLPIFCIGGVKKENLALVTAAGAKRAVIVSGILQAGDIAAYVSEAKEILT